MILNFMFILSAAQGNTTGKAMDVTAPGSVTPNESAGHKGATRKGLTVIYPKNFPTRPKSFSSDAEQ